MKKIVKLKKKLSEGVAAEENRIPLREMPWGEVMVFKVVIMKTIPCPK